MDNRNGHESFTYTYSAKQQEELKAKYGDKMSPEMEEAQLSKEESKKMADDLHAAFVKAGLIKDGQK